MYTNPSRLKGLAITVSGGARPEITSGATLRRSPGSGLVPLVSDHGEHASVSTIQTYYTAVISARRPGAATAQAPPSWHSGRLTPDLVLPARTVPALCLLHTI